MADGGRRGGSGSSGSATGVPTFSRETADDGHARPAAHRRSAHAARTHHDRSERDQRLNHRQSGALADVPSQRDPRRADARHGARCPRPRGGMLSAWSSSTKSRPGRQLRYTYTPTANPEQLLIDIRFLEHGHEGDEVKLTYERPDAHERTLL